MKAKLCAQWVTITLLTLAASSARADTVLYPPGTGPTLKAISFTRLFNRGVTMLEMPPVVLKPASTSQPKYLLGGIESSICINPNTLFSLANTTLYCQVNATAVVDSYQRNYPFYSHQVMNEAPWRRNYHGVFSAHQFAVNGVQTIYAVMHGENKGESSPYLGQGVGPFPNTVAPNMTNTASGTPGSSCYDENDGCYFGFVTLSRTDASQANGYGIHSDVTDLGPITWPTAGYASPDGLLKYSSGPRHPSSIVVDTEGGKYLYVFYVDVNYTNDRDGLRDMFQGSAWEGRQSGVKVIRVPINATYGPDLRYFKAYYNGKFDQPTLPAGFDKNNALASVSTPGPLTTSILGNSASTISFSVAELRGGTYKYVGLEQYQDFNSSAANKVLIALRFSNNLVDWTIRRNIYATASWSTSRLNYPKFLDKNQASNSVVDADLFYVLGTGARQTPSLDFQLNVATVSLQTASPAQPSVASIQKRNVYRSRQGNLHFYTLNAAEWFGDGTQQEGTAFQVLLNPAPGTVALNRCRVTNAPTYLQFVSRDAGCEGQTHEGVLGYIYNQNGNPLETLYRATQPQTWDHLVTKYANEGAEYGYINEGIIGYAPK